jgi:hypothetical protein
LLWNSFFTNLHFHAKFEGTVSALAAAKTEFDDAFTTQNPKMNKSDEVVKTWFCKSIICLVKCGNDIYFFCAVMRQIVRF